MPDQYTNEPMLDMFIFETSQLIEQLENSILTSEKSNSLTQDAINEMFRAMHTIKGSSAMMMFNNISSLAHSMEDLFYFIREEKPHHVDFSALSDLVLETVDFIKVEVEKIKSGDAADGNESELIGRLAAFLSVLRQENRPGALDQNDKTTVQCCEEEKQKFYISQKKEQDGFSNAAAFRAVIRFEEGCEMENIRAYTVIHNLTEITQEVFYIPQDIIDGRGSADIIRRDGFIIFFKADRSYDQMTEFFMQTIFLESLDLKQLENDDEFMKFNEKKQADDKNDFLAGTQKPDQNTNEGAANNCCERNEASGRESSCASTQQSLISVSVVKLDKLMDLVGEMVISEAMVIQNPDLMGLELSNFQKAARQLHKITGELQDTVMSIRMVPLSATFLKMHRIVRDMCKKLGKDVELKITGEETEVDKNVIEHISDPLMHLVRNALDHGIEAPEDRLANGKSETGIVSLEAKNAGSDVLVIIKDDGRGLDSEKILAKAAENGLLYKPKDQMTEKEIFNLIFLPGFSTNENVTEFSGRGVGMDVVMKNIETIGGAVSVDSVPGKGCTFTLKIPLTLAIIDGMNIRVGSSRYTIPTASIRESFRPGEKDVFTDPDGNEMVMVRGRCYPILRLHSLFKIKNATTRLENGIIIMTELDDRTVCIFADELLGQQQVVVKALPEYIKRFKKIKGLAGCTLLGDGCISLILDISGLTGSQNGAGKPEGEGMREWRTQM